MPNLAHIIAEETQDGRLIVRFLLSAMHGELTGFLPCHRIDAAKLLVKLGFDQAQAQAVIDHAAAQRAAAAANRAANHNPYRDSRYQPQAQPQQSEAADAARRVRAQLAEIVREETDDGRVAVQFLVEVMQGELPDFKPCHRISAAKELLQRGFDYVPDADDPAAAAEPEPTPEELAAQRRRTDDIEFSRHGRVYYKSYSYPCVCEDRLHDCKGNVLNAERREQFSRQAPAAQHYVLEADEIADYLARYAEYLTVWNAEHPENPIDLNRIHWLSKGWQHLNPPGSVNPYWNAFKPIRGP